MSKAERVVVEIPAPRNHNKSVWEYSFTALYFVFTVLWVHHILLVFWAAECKMCSHKLELLVIGIDEVQAYSYLFWIIIKLHSKPLNPRYLYKDTKNSEAIFVVKCVQNIGIFRIVANKVQLSRTKHKNF